jgi:hypothetical protein
MHSTTINMHQTNLKSRILDDVIMNQHYLHVKESLYKENIQHSFREYKMGKYGVLMHKNRIYVPNSREIRNLVLKEMHNVPYSKHHSYQKIVAAIRSQYFSLGMKKDVSYYI